MRGFRAYTFQLLFNISITISFNCYPDWDISYAYWHDYYAINFDLYTTHIQINWRNKFQPSWAIYHFPNTSRNLKQPDEVILNELHASYSPELLEILKEIKTPKRPQ